MSADVTWERPPVEVEQHGTDSRLHAMLIDECFAGDSSSTAECRIDRGDLVHQRLAGALAGLAYAGGQDAEGTELGDFHDDIEALLGGIGKWGAVIVRVTR